MSDLERLNVRIAHSGLCSRRAAADLVREGRVEVNGEFAVEPGIKVGDADDVRVDGRPLKVQRKLTVILHKPRGVLTTMDDPHGRKTVADILPDMGVTLRPVGRLDMETDGLLICTSDGDLAFRLTHARFGVEKEYRATVRGIPSDKAIESLCKGVFIEGRRTAPAKVWLVAPDAKGSKATLGFILHEGRKRQIRMMCESVGHPVETLRRVRIGPLLLKGLRPGEVRLLGQKEVQQLQRMVGLTK